MLNDDHEIEPRSPGSLGRPLLQAIAYGGHIEVKNKGGGIRKVAVARGLSDD